MNLTTFLISFVFIIFLGWVTYKLYSHSKNVAEDDENKRLFLTLSKLLFIVTFFITITTIQVSGVVKLPDPFQGQKITNEIPNKAYGTPNVESPEVSAVPIKPDFDGVAAEHKKRLEQFEGK